MPFMVISAFMAGLLAIALVHSIRNRSPIRSGLAILGLVLLLFAVAIKNPEPIKIRVSPVAVEDFGDAAFKEFYSRYSNFLGAPVSPAGQSEEALSQWFKFARVDFKQDKESPSHPDFPKLSLAPLGQKALERAGVPVAPNNKIPDIIESYISSREKDDFYPDFQVQQPTYSKDSPLLVQNFGQAQFKDFYDRYSSILGEPISPAGLYKGILSQWFQYGRVEFHTEYDQSLHQQFPKLQMGLVGREYLQQQGLIPDPQAQVAPILERWFSSNAGKQDILYFYGNPVTNPQVDESTGFTRQYFEREVFSWQNGSTEPNDVFRLSVGLELFNRIQVSTGDADNKKAREAFRSYFFGEPLTNEIMNKETGLSTMYFKRAVFQWPTGTKDPTDVRQLPIGSDLYSSSEAIPDTSPWGNPVKVILLTLSGVILILSGVLAFLMRENNQVYGGL